MARRCFATPDPLNRRNVKYPIGHGKKRQDLDELTFVPKNLMRGGEWGPEYVNRSFAIALGKPSAICRARTLRQPSVTDPSARSE